MQFPRIETNKTLALTRVNKLLGRVFSIAAILIGIETVANAVTQFSQANLNPFWFWVSFGSVAISHLLIIWFVWVRGDGKIGFAALTVSTFFSLLTWALQLDGNALADGEKSWIWWGLGIAGISAVGGFGLVIGSVFLVLLPATWFLTEISNIDSAVNPWLASQDSVFSFLFSSILGLLVVTLRYEAAKVDSANQKANYAAIELAKQDAVDRERDRVDALVHDSVLTTLLVAANANDLDSQKRAAALAREAIDKLTHIEENSSDQQKISTNSFFGALAVAVERQNEEVFLHSKGQSDLLIPADVAEAVTEATLQAVANASQHSGANSKIDVILKGSNRGIKIVVTDNGRGFRPAQIPPNRLGLKLSIIGRMQSVGGKAFIDSKIGTGTNVIIEWGSE